MYVLSLVAQSCLTLYDPVDCSLPGFSVHGILQARILEWASILFSRDLPDLGIEPGSPALQADSLLSEPPGKPNVCQIILFQNTPVLSLTAVCRALHCPPRAVTA